MVTEREEKLAAARKKLARFQQTKTSSKSMPPTHQPPQPPTQMMDRSGEQSTSPAQEVTVQDNGHQPLYSNPTPTFQHIQPTAAQAQSLNAIQLAELEAAKHQLREHQPRRDHKFL